MEDKAGRHRAAVRGEYTGRHRALAEPTMDGYARHHRAPRPRRRGGPGHGPLLLVAAVLLLITTLFVSAQSPTVVPTDGPGVDPSQTEEAAPTAGAGPDRAVGEGIIGGKEGAGGRDLPVPPVSAPPAPVRTEDSERAARDEAQHPGVNAKDQDAVPTTTVVPGPEPAGAPCKDCDPPAGAAGAIEAQAAPPDPTAAPPPAPQPAPQPPPAAAAVPPEVPRPQLDPALDGPGVPTPGQECATVLGRARVQPYVAQAGHHLAQRFQFPLSQILGRGARPGNATSDHPRGRALDFLVFNNRQLGDALADYVREHHDELGAKYVIWRQRIDEFDGNGWQDMEDRGGTTANHFDHVHISFKRTPGSGLPC